MKSIYGQALKESLIRQLDQAKEEQNIRMQHIMDCDFDLDDCFISKNLTDNRIHELNSKIDFMEGDGTAWIMEYATLDGQILEDARWISTKFGFKLVATMPDGTKVWTSAHTAKGLAKKGIKKVYARYTAWIFTEYGNTLGSAWTVIKKANWNRVTGEQGCKLYEVRDADDDE